jgi:hypothetical protein
MLTLWEKELEMLEDWLNNPKELEKDCQETIMHRAEFQSEEQLEEDGVEPTQEELA